MYPTSFDLSEMVAPLLPQIDEEALLASDEPSHIHVTHTRTHHTLSPHHVDQHAVSPLTSLVRSVARNIDSYNANPYMIQPSELLINPSGTPPVGGLGMSLGRGRSPSWSSSTPL